MRTSCWRTGIGTAATVLCDMALVVAAALVANCVSAGGDSLSNPGTDNPGGGSSGGGSSGGGSSGGTSSGGGSSGGSSSGGDNGTPGCASDYGTPPSDDKCSCVYADCAGTTLTCKCNVSCYQDPSCVINVDPNGNATSPDGTLGSCGSLSCNPEDDLTTEISCSASNCQPPAPPAPVCGNGKVETGEECDNGAANGTTGNACRSDCSLGPVCGNGKVETGEECDNGAANGTTGNACRSDCSVAPAPAPKCAALDASVAFHESEIITGVSPAVARASDVIKAFYVDEHALTLGAADNGYTVSPCTASPDSKINPSIGDPDAVDPAGRPIYPTLFLTDITTAPDSTSGDWQKGGTPIPPTAVYGTWKAADAGDPAKNRYNVGNGDAVPHLQLGMHDFGSEYFSAEVQWSVSALGLVSGHNYRVQIILHDGDQNGDGGDAGQVCVVVQNN